MSKKRLLATVTTTGVLVAATAGLAAAQEPVGAAIAPQVSPAAAMAPPATTATGTERVAKPKKKKRVYVVTRHKSKYRADFRGKGPTYRGKLKRVLQASAADLQRRGGGKIKFTKGTFDFGGGSYVGRGVRGIAFVGEGIHKTRIKNFSKADRDTEPFNFSGVRDVRIRKMTIFAGGPPRTTSDAMDFDRGSDVVVSDVRIKASRGRGIVFDGKDEGSFSRSNRVVRCIIRNVPSHGIELLAVEATTIRDCRISDAGRSGIVVAKSSPQASQPNKKSTRNFILDNRIHNAGEHGIHVLSSDDNRVVGNRITASSDDSERKDGIRVASTDNVTCNDNVVTDNKATDGQSPKTQTYGLNIADRKCHRTVISGNRLAGNLLGGLQDLGTNTL